MIRLAAFLALCFVAGWFAPDFIQWIRRWLP